MMTVVIHTNIASRSIVLALLGSNVHAVVMDTHIHNLRQGSQKMRLGDNICVYVSI